MKQKLLTTMILVFLLVFFGKGVWGQTPFTATYTFTGTTGNVASFAYNGTVYDGITPGDIVKVGVTTSSSTGNFRASNWPLGAISGSEVFTGDVDLAKYFEFTISAVSGYKFTVTSITFGVGRSSTGIRQSEWRGSDDSYGSIVDNYTTLNAGLTNDVGVLTNPDANSNWTGNVLEPGAAYVDILTSAGFRYYLFNSESNTGTAGLQGAITITGTFQVASGNTPPTITSITNTPTIPTSSQTVSVSADITDSDGTISLSQLKWGTTAGVYPNTINMTLGAGSTYSTDSDIPAQIDGTTVYYVVYAEDDASEPTTSPEQSYTVTNLSPEPSGHVTNFAAGTTTSATIPLSWTDSDAAFYLIKGVVTGTTITDPVDGTAEANSALVQNVAAGDEAYTFTGLNHSTSYDFKIYPFNGTGTSVNYKTDGTIPDASAYTKSATATLPYDQTFDSDFGDCSTFSVSGDTRDWNVTSGYAEANGWGGSNPEEDWLILPQIDFSSSSNVIMTFDTWWNYGNADGNNYLKLYYSSDYPGYGTPVGYTWNELSFPMPDIANFWRNSSAVDLSALTGTSVYIGFKYYSTDAPRDWRVDNISIYEGSLVDVTFQVNMENQTPSVNGVHVAGGFNGWSPSVTELTDIDVDNIYTVTLSLYSGVEYQFKYINGNAWDGSEETVPVGCQAPGTTNRFETIGATNYAINAVCFNECNDCGFVQYRDVTFRVNMQNETISGDGVYLAGSFTNWGTSAILLTNTSGSIWETTVALEESSSPEYKFVNGNPNTSGEWEEFSGACLIGDYASNRVFVVPAENTTLGLVCFNSCDACPSSTDLIISEVTDAKDIYQTRFIEIYNPSTAVIDFDLNDWYMSRQTNGGSWEDKKLTGLIVQGGKYVAANSNSDASDYFYINFGFMADFNYGGSSGNGDDGYFLYYGGDHTTGTLIDAYGVIDQDGSGYAWEYTDRKAVRLRSISEPNATWTASEWNIPTQANVANMTPSEHKADVTWQGTISDAWNAKGTNWSGTYGFIPDASFNVTIPSTGITNYPTILATATCNNLTIQSSASGNGSILGDNNLTVSGSISVERYITGGVWHDLSASTQNQTVNNLYFNHTPDVWLKSYNEPTNTRLPITSLSTPLTSGAGFEIWVETGNNVTVSYNGALRTTDVTLTTSSTPALSYSGADPLGYNLIGNPFASPLDWDLGTWGLSNMTNGIWVWNGSTYLDWVGGAGSLTGGIIPMGQGFFVQTTSAAASITIPMDARVHSAQAYYKGVTNAPDHMWIKAIKGEKIDQLTVVFAEDATLGFDNGRDSRKMLAFYGNAPQIYAVEQDEKFGIDGLPTLTEAGRTVNVMYHVGESGDQQLLANLESLPDVKVLLEDAQTGIVQDLNENPEYLFEAAQGDDPNRFTLYFNPTPTMISNLGDHSDVHVYAFQNEIYVRSEGEAVNASKTIWVYDMYGRVILNTVIPPSTLTKIPLDVRNTPVIVKVVGTGSVVTSKVVIN